MAEEEGFVRSAKRDGIAQQSGASRGRCPHSGASRRRGKIDEKEKEKQFGFSFLFRL